MLGGWRGTSLETIDVTEHLFETKRLSQNIHSSGLSSLFEQRGFAETGHHDDMGSGTEIANLGKAFDSVLAGQFDIHESDVVTHVLEFSDRLFPGSCNIHITIMHPKSYHQTLGKIRVIFDNENLGRDLSHQNPTEWTSNISMDDTHITQKFSVRYNYAEESTGYYEF
jgi:hypothetical protein